MACILSVCPSADADYQGTNGSTFEVGVSSTSGTAILSYALYNGTGLTTAPFQFKVVAGVNVLTLVVVSLSMGDRVSIDEVTAGCSQVLDAFNYTPSQPPDALEIKGL